MQPVRLRRVDVRQARVPLSTTGIDASGRRRPVQCRVVRVEATTAVDRRQITAETRLRLAAGQARTGELQSRPGRSLGRRLSRHPSFWYRMPQLRNRILGDPTGFWPPLRPVLAAPAEKKTEFSAILPDFWPPFLPVLTAPADEQYSRRPYRTLRTTATGLC